MNESPVKGIYIGAPACFALELACRQICEAFGGHHCYVVGSSLERADWRDVDVRYMLEDDAFTVREVPYTAVKLASVLLSLRVMVSASCPTVRVLEAKFDAE